MRHGRTPRRVIALMAWMPVVAGGLAGCASRGVIHCERPLVTFNVNGHSYGGGCSAQYSDLGPVTVKVGTKFTAAVPKTGYPLPASANSSIVGLVSKRKRDERFRAVAPGTVALMVFSSHCYRGPASMKSHGRTVTLPTVFPRVWCTVLTVRVSAA
jgi:hypothetical protein